MRLRWRGSVPKLPPRYMDETRHISAEEIAKAVDRMVAEMAARHRDSMHLAVAGIANGGIVLARRVARALMPKLNRPIPCGVVNITFHRDDIGMKPIPLDTAPTDFPFDMDGVSLILVDDVLFSGRTVRAALEEVFDQGRPERVELAVLFDRETRSLPVKADYVGFSEKAPPPKRVQVRLDLNHPQNDVISLFSA